MLPIFLLVVLLIVMVFILPLAAMSRASESKRKADQLAGRVDFLQQEMEQLRADLKSRPATPQTRETKGEARKSAAHEPRPSPSAIEVLNAIRGHEPTKTEEAKPPAAVPVDTVPPPLPADEPKAARACSTESPTAEPRFVAVQARPRFDAKSAFEKINWEQFMGVRLFAWLGGFAMFLAAAFFVKYSFDNGLIAPWLRVAMGFAAGIGMLVGGIRMSQKKYKITADTLIATGVVILYAVTFACRSVYEFTFFTPVPTFIIMVIITATAFLLAVRLNALVVAVLGMLGGFLTPILVSTGHDNPVGLFSYVALLDIGLIAVAYARRWDWLAFAAAICTVLMELGWVIEFMAPEKIYIAMTVFLGFCALFFGSNLWMQRRGHQNVWLDVATLILPAATFLFVPYLIADPGLGSRPGILYLFLLGADLAVIGLAVSRANLRLFNQISGAVVFLLLALWTVVRIDDGLLFWALGGYFGFAVLHTAIPIYLQRRNPDQPLAPWTHLFPVVTLILTILPLLKLDAPPVVIWPFILLVDLLAIGLAILAASIGAILIVLLTTVGIAFLWLLNMPTDIGGLPEMLIVLGGIAAVFTVAGVVGGKKIIERQTENGMNGDSMFVPPGWLPNDVQQQIPALSAILPFLLLTIVTARLPLENPSPVFGLGLVLGALLLGLAKFFRMDWLPAVGLGCTFLLECAWHVQHFQTPVAGVALVWYLVFYAMYLAFPFVFLRGEGDRIVPWGTAALAGPVHFFLVHRLVEQAWPNDVMGLIPALFAMPAIVGLAMLFKDIPVTHPKRNTILAGFGGVALFFITLIFPIQFDRQWLTIGWALEGAALLWLFHRIPHHGLRYVGVGLLVVAFARLALNNAVLGYSPRSEMAILNWYLYAYGIVTVALFVGARLLKEPNEKLFDKDARPLLLTLGTVLAFLLMNIEIADFFSKPGQHKLTFDFSGNFARDLCYTIGWALFAFVLLLIGILRRWRTVRWAGIGLLAVTLLKLFFHDLATLKELYRVCAFAGVATVAFVVSFLYQKFLSGKFRDGADGDTADVSTPDQK